MKKPHIICIAPYSGMKEIIQNIAAKRSDITLSVYLGDREDGLQALTDHLTTDVEAVISRGITADMICASCHLPTIRIHFSAFDALRAIKTAQTLGENFAIVGLPDVTTSTRMLCDALCYHHQIYELKSQDETDQVLLDLKRQGCSLIVGDLYTVSRAQRLAMRGILIVSGIESIEETINLAKQTILQNRISNRQTSLYEHLLQTLSTKVAVFHVTEKQLVFTSLTAEELTLLHPHFQRLLAENSHNSDAQTIQANENQVYRITPLYIQEEDSLYAAFQIDIHTLPYREMAKTITYMNNNELTSSFFPISNCSAESSKFQALLPLCASTKSPVLLIGEIGTRIDSTAVHLHRIGNYSNGSFIIIDTTLCTEKTWQYLFKNSNSPFFGKNATIHLKNFTQLSQSRLTELVYFLANADFQRRLQVILSGTLTNDMTAKMLYERHPLLYSHFFTLQLPALREHADDIWELSNLYLNELSLKSGRHVIGLTPDAGEVLQSYSWPQNDEQLRKTLLQAMLLTDKSYISSEDILSIIDHENEAISPANHKIDSIEYGKTLKEIEYDIVNAILAQENMNQSRAAKRLGISRSTIWRILSNGKP